MYEFGPEGRKLSAAFDAGFYTCLRWCFGIFVVAVTIFALTK
jgi:hypothetical protein